ncbi:MAG: SpoIIE family protein phosphatase [Bacteroidales bacterium]|nr:SpoIIE family protein phosphatase [Bacteroidales bacterium]
MKTDNKRTTIFKQLILNIVIPAILAMLTLGIINVSQTLTILSESSENKSRIISDEIRQLHEMQDMALGILEQNYDPQLERYSKILVNEIFRNTDGIEDADLDAIRRSIGMDTEKQDIYIINKQGVVVNTTFEPDMGFPFFSLGPEHRELLENVWMSEEFHSEPFTIEQNTKRLKKYTYIPTLDGKYLIEIGVYSAEADNIIDFVKQRMNSMSDIQSNILSADLFIGKENPLCLNGDAAISPEYMDEYKEAMDMKQRKTVEDRKNKPPIRIEFIFMDRQNTDLYKESVIRIVSDISQEVNTLRRELLKFLVVFAIAILVVVILLYKKTKVITDPIKKLVDNVNRITAGHLNERAEVMGNNEITSLSEQFNDMIAQLESYYNELEEKVRIRTAEVVAQKEEIEAQRDTLRDQRNLLAKTNESLNKAYTEIEDSIHYASRIQNAILPPDDYLKKLIPNAFFFYKPRDIVSGDFYWVASKGNKVIISAVDCTGHGVPGAFMSIVGNNQLNYALNIENKTQPSEILEILDRGVTDTLRQTKDESVQDGMDLAMVTIDWEEKKLQFSGAFNPLIMVREGELIKVKGDRLPIGGHFIQSEKNFTNHEIDYQDGDMIYIYSDGFPDQFGGEKGGKYMSGKFNKFLQSIADQPVEKQYGLLEKELKEWMGEEVQIDDILVIGVKL